MSRRRARGIALLLHDDHAVDMREAVADRRALVRRLILADLLAPPPALREPGDVTPLSPKSES